MTLERGFIIAASAEIFWRETVLPADRSTMAIWDCPVSHTVINLSDSIEHDPNLTFSRGIDKGAEESCKKKKDRCERSTELLVEIWEDCQPKLTFKISLKVIGICAIFNSLTLVP